MGVVICSALTNPINGKVFLTSFGSVGITGADKTCQTIEHDGSSPMG